MMETPEHVAADATHASGPAVLPQEEEWRADLYDVLAALLANAPTQELLDKSCTLEGDDSAIGKGVTALARVSKAVTEKAVRSEYNALFIGLGRGELLPYASFYMTGFLNEKPLAKLRQDMSEIGVIREESVFEPEDHIATVCEIMAGLIRGRFGEPASLADQRTFFDKHLADWAEHFFRDLEGAQASVFYAPVGTIGRSLMEVEAEAFRMES